VRLTRVAVIVIVAACVAILAATVRPDFSLGARSWTNCIICGGRGTADAIVNLILFAPLGVGLALARVPVGLAVLAGALLSAVAESAQTVLPGRDPGLGDLLFNTAGAGIGYALVPLTLALARFTDRTAARLSLAAGFLVALGVAATGWLLQPSLYPSAYWGLWTPRLGHLAWYRGRVTSAKIDGVEVPYRRIRDSAWARSALLSGRAIEVEAIAGPPVRAVAPLFGVFDDHHVEMVLIGPDREDLVYRYRTRAVALRLDQPDLRLRRGMRGIAAGDSLRVRVWSPAPGSHCLTTPAAQACGLGFTPGAGWGLLLYPESFPEWLRRGLSLGWVGTLVLPLGFLLRRRWESAVALAVAATAFGALPIVVALRPTGAGEWLGIALGLAAGTIASGAVRRYRPLTPAPASPSPAPFQVDEDGITQ